MNESNQYWQGVVDALHGRGFQFRIKWSGDDTMTDWQSAVFCPVPGYLETGALGPVPVREVEWVDVALHNRKAEDVSETIKKILTQLGARFTSTADSVQISYSESQQ